MEFDSIHRYTATPAIIVRTLWEAVQVLLHVGLRKRDRERYVNPVAL